MVGTNVSDRRGPWPFTDCVLIGTDGRGTGAYASAKALSTKDDPVDGVRAPAWRCWPPTSAFR